ncbi:MAG: hypothetical protein Q7T66_04900 [Herminiimonas sp.]|uniref:hypothetical protein n=1 Tax=Herminiimonas sp. TaxID=1926289 RepID=UPI0027162025|nr:hypothetical protein [Herminiimonas sp.]MDO9419984.1 hypothetical protein [Herminiimonas sp.]
MRSLICFGLFFTLCGCAAPQPKMLTKNVSDSEAAQDNAACKMQSMMNSSADWEYRGTMFEGAAIQMKQNKIMELCLQSKGYK